VGWTDFFVTQKSNAQMLLMYFKEEKSALIQLYDKKNNNSK
jgi:hypothetical protein